LDTATFVASPSRTIDSSPKFPDIQCPESVESGCLDARFFPAPVREGMKFERRGDFFNLPNRTNFGAPGRTLGNPNFGQITSAQFARTLQLGLKRWY